jgi:hypothetical protein
MPAKSKKQQMAAGAALAANRGDRSKSSLKGASKQMVSSMSETELRKNGSHEAQKASTRLEDVAACWWSRSHSGCPTLSLGPIIATAGFVAPFVLPPAELPQDARSMR